MYCGTYLSRDEGEKSKEVEHCVCVVVREYLMFEGSKQRSLCWRSVASLDIIRGEALSDLDERGDTGVYYKKAEAQDRWII